MSTIRPCLLFGFLTFFGVAIQTTALILIQNMSLQSLQVDNCNIQIKTTLTQVLKYFWQPHVRALITIVAFWLVNGLINCTLSMCGISSLFLSTKVHLHDKLIQFQLCLSSIQSFLPNQSCSKYALLQKWDSLMIIKQNLH
jgi:hypothetical protein